jgi:hypothetical protein
MKKTVLKATLACALVSFALCTDAQALTPPGGGGGPKDPGHHNAPFDGGASLLVGAGIVYGIKKAYNSRKKGNQ